VLFQVIQTFLNEVNRRNQINFLWRIPRNRISTALQENGSDCGAYVCKYIERLCNEESTIFEASTMDAYRQHLKTVLLA